MVAGPCAPLPGLALQIGVVGHRSNKIDDSSTLRTTLRSVLLELEDAAATVAQPSMGRLYAPGRPTIRVVSALAEGADRCGGEAAVDRYELCAVLPMPRDEYKRDFASDESIAEFDRLLAQARIVTELVAPGKADYRNEAVRVGQYRAVGEFLLRQIDVLVAVWDGKAAAGAGGTGEVVAAALALGLPIVWINLAAAKGTTFLCSLSASGEAEACKPFNAETAAAALSPTLAAPCSSRSNERAHAEQCSPNSHDGAQTPAYLSRPWPEKLYWPFAYNLLRRLCGAGRAPWPLSYGAFDDQIGDWSGFCETAPPSTTAAELKSKLAPLSVWADALGWTYAQTYRSAYVTIFALAGLAPPLGLIYLFFIESPNVLGIKAAFVFAELVIISTIVKVVRMGVRDAWHGLWIESRELAELLRQGRALAYVGAQREFLSAPQAQGHETVAAWLTRAAYRQIGPPDGRLGDVYLRRALGAMMAEIADQRAYHAANSTNLTRMHHVLHRAGEACFFATSAILVLYLAVWALDLAVSTAAAEAVAHAHAGEGQAPGFLHAHLENWIKPLVSILGAGLPACGAAFAGINAQADFLGFAKRSRSTAAALGAIAWQVEAELASSAPVELGAAVALIRSASAAMAADVSAWREAYLAKRLILPS